MVACGSMWKRPYWKSKCWMNEKRRRSRKTKKKKKTEKICGFHLLHYMFGIHETWPLSYLRIKLQLNIILLFFCRLALLTWNDNNNNIRYFQKKHLIIIWVQLSSQCCCRPTFHSSPMQNAPLSLFLLLTRPPSLFRSISIVVGSILFAWTLAHSNDVNISSTRARNHESHTHTRMALARGGCSAMIIFNRSSLLPTHTTTNVHNSSVCWAPWKMCECVRVALGNDSVVLS